MLILNANLAAEMTDTSQGALNTAEMFMWILAGIAILFAVWGILKALLNRQKDKRQLRKLKKAVQPAGREEDSDHRSSHAYSAQRLRGEDKTKSLQREERRSQWERERKKSSLK